MKQLYNIIGLLILAIGAIAGFQSCEKKNDSPNGGEPDIRYIRLTNPVTSDSLITGAYRGQLIVLVGNNLEGAREVWFNDQRALLSPTFITSQTIQVRVPDGVPREVTNKIRLILESGQELEYDFQVVIGAPELNSMRCEYVADGEVATIRGSNFFEPLTVVFSGGAAAEIVSVEDKILQVRVPAGAQAGPLTVTSNFGETVSDLWFRDNRNIFLGGDPVEGWQETWVWEKPNLVKEPGENDPPRINGNYMRITREVGSGQWVVVGGGPPTVTGAYAHDVPDDAIENPVNYNLKFEVNTLKPYMANKLIINVGLYSRNGPDFTDGFDNLNYGWAPPYDSKGEWETVVIPFEEVMQSYSRNNSAGGINPNDWGYNIRVRFDGLGILDCDMAFDNFRVVPKIHKG